MPKVSQEYVDLIYESCGHDINGLISVDELMKKLSKGQDATAVEKLKTMLEKLGKKEDGKMSKDEVKKMLEEIALDRKRLEETFKAMDKDSSRYLTKEELKAAMEKMPLPGLCGRKIDIMMAKMDANKDGKVSCEEFLKIMTGQ